jgi:hypothetical protein
MNNSPPVYPLPETGGHYLVKCENFMCYAIFDQDSKWKSFPDGKELPDVIHFCPTQSINAAAPSNPLLQAA